MAYQARGRDPLIDSTTQAALERRGRELLGVCLVVLGVLTAMMVWSYHPEDPSWWSATDAPVQNWTGRFGASIAAPLFMICGRGLWGVAIVLIVWGVRFAVHRGEDRVFPAILFAPLWIAGVTVYAAGQTVGSEWSHSFGMGGMFGDMVMGSLMTALPLSSGIALTALMVLMAVGVAFFAAFVLGFTRAEVQSILRFLVVGVIMVYATLMNALGRGAQGAVGAAQALQARSAQRREEARLAAEETAAWEETQSAEVALDTPEEPTFLQRVRDRIAGNADPVEEASEVVPEQTEAPSLLARMPSLVRRAAPPADVETEDNVFIDDPAPEDRIKRKIATVVRARKGEASEEVVAEKPLTRGRGRKPDPLILETQPRKTRPEPPLTAAHAQPSVTSIVPPAPVTLPAHSLAYQEGQNFERAPSGPSTFEPGVFDDEGFDPALETLSDQPADDVSFAAPIVEPSPYLPDATAYAPSGDVAIGEPAQDTAADWQPVDDNGQTPEPIVTYRPAPEAPRKVVQQPVRKPVALSRRAKAEAEPQLAFDPSEAQFELPPLGLLMDPSGIERHVLSDEALEENARMLESVLDDYGVKGEIVSVRPGPVVTMYELEPAPGLKASRVIGLADDIARSMSALSARVSTVPGRSVIGIELPNDNREMVALREILAARDYGDGKHKLPLALGKDIGGDPIVANLAKMPHLLIAGTTGSGKSVAINTMILSLLYKLTPDECRMIMIDPKMLELSVYDGIPHLLSPVVTDPKKAVVALKWVVAEMEDRYRKMSKMGVRNIDGYNGRVKHALAQGEMFSRTVQTGFDEDTGDPIFETEEFEPKTMPYIVVIVDEMADLMMVAGKEIEACIQRLAQMARASGIHLIMATQRPSVDVITGTIKANFPTRISFQVTSKIDSRTILGEMGAEQLLGMGDMLYMAGGSKIVRCHGPFCSDEEVEEVVTHLKAYGPPDYVGGVVEGPDEEKAENIDAVLGLNTGGNTGGEDALYDQAVAIVIKDRKCSTSYIQRKLGIGYNKAARLVEQMEDQGVVSSANHVGKREILVPEQ